MIASERGTHAPPPPHAVKAIEMSAEDVVCGAGVRDEQAAATRASPTSRVALHLTTLDVNILPPGPAGNASTDSIALVQRVTVDEPRARTPDAST